MNKSIFGPAGNAFWIFTIAVFCGLILPFIVQDGMFLDGIFYAAISKNLAHNIGTFWNPHYSNTFYPSLHEQPPLMFWMQGQFFRLLGDSIYVERFYSLLMAVLNAIGIGLIWKEIFINKSTIKQHGWLPILFWIIIPICYWTYINNLEECTMSMFDLFAVFLIIKSFNSVIQSNRIIYFIAAGLCIYLASLTKGIQGLFPLIVVALRYITHKDISFKRMLLYSIIIFAVPALIYLYLMSHPVIRESYHQYFQRRFVLTFNNNNKTTDFRPYLLFRLITELTPVIILTGIIMAFLRNKFASGEYYINHNKDILLFLFIGLSASMPLMITLEQRGFYLTTSLPYYAIAFAMIAIPFISNQIELLSMRIMSIFKTISFVLIAIIFVITCIEIGKTKRDEEMLHDVYLIGKTIPLQATVSVDKELFYKWNLQAYFQRYYNISLDEDTLRNYLLVDKKNTGKSIPKDFQKMEIPTIKYDLYKSMNQVQ